MLRAFGPFTDEELDLSGGSPGGLHVIYGPNEAGKSTSLRAVKGLLFGIPARSNDAHLHASARLVVEAEISDGDLRYALSRRKRKKDSLVDLSGNPLAHDPLPALLGHLDEESFSLRFGLDQNELARGAEALLGGSEQGLFAAGTAGAQARLVLDELSAQADALYLSRGRVPRLNRALSEHDRLSREARKAERPPEKWLEQQRAVEQTEREVEALRAERAKVRAELKQKNRLRSQLSDLFELEQTEAAYLALGPVPELPEDAQSKREEAQLKWSEAQVEVRRIREELGSFEAELAQLPPDSPLCDVDDEQLSLGTRVGTALSARKDLPKREGSMLEQSRQLGDLLSEMGWEYERGHELEVAERALSRSSTKSVVRRLLKQRGALEVEVEQARRAEHESRLERERFERQSPSLEMSLKDRSALEVALADAHAMQALAQTLVQDERSLSECGALVKQLRLATGCERGWEELARLVPSEEAQAEALSAYREAHAAVGHSEAEVARIEQRLSALREDLAEAQAAGLPSEEELAQAKISRDDSLSRAEKEPTPPAFQVLRENINAVDVVSERLRAEADRIFKEASLRSSIQDLSREAEEKTQELTTLKETRDRLILAEHERAQALGFHEAVDPVSATRLYSSLRELIDGLREMDVLTERASEATRALSDVTSALAKWIPEAPVDAGLAGLLVIGRRRLRLAEQAEDAEIKRQEDARLALSRQREAEVRRRKAEDALSAWEQQWAQAVLPLGLDRHADVTRAEDVLDALERLARSVDIARTLEGRILGMKRDTAALVSDVLGVAQRHAPEMLTSLREMDEVDAAVRVQEAIKLARKHQEERIRLRRHMDARRDALAQAELRLASSQKQLSLLMKQAGVSRVDELPGVESRSQKAVELRRKLAQLESRLRENSSGTPLSELREEGRKWQGKSRVLVSLIDDLDDENQRLDELLRVAESHAESMRLGLFVYRSEDAVIARQMSAEASAEAVSLLREYLVLKTAHTLLERQVKEFAERFAGPLVQRASQIFQRMTLGRYSRLKIGLGEQVLRCVREKEEVEVSQLSRGTRAQLYFALRVSSLEAYFSEQPAVPLVFDDLFVDFDDDRTTAAFEILAELAKRVQVLYFTHLARDVEAAENAVPAGLLFQHRISVG